MKTLAWVHDHTRRAATAWRGRWQALTMRDRRMLLLGLSACLLYGLWQWGVGPALQAAAHSRQALLASRSEARALDALLHAHAETVPPPAGKREAALRRSLLATLPGAEWRLHARADDRWELHVQQAPAAGLSAWVLQVPQRLGLHVIALDLQRHRRARAIDLAGTVVLANDNDRTSE
jgi:general secretion pathway protein M